MEGIQSAGGAASQAQGILKDIAGAQVITKTLDKLHTTQSFNGPKIDADYQFQKDVLSAAGIGTMLDKIA